MRDGRLGRTECVAPVCRPSLPLSMYMELVETAVIQFTVLLLVRVALSDAAKRRPCAAVLHTPLSVGLPRRGAAVDGGRNRGRVLRIGDINSGTRRTCMLPQPMALLG